METLQYDSNNPNSRRNEVAWRNLAGNHPLCNIYVILREDSAVAPHFHYS